MRINSRDLLFFLAKISLFTILPADFFADPQYRRELIGSAAAESTVASRLKIFQPTKSYLRRWGLTLQNLPELHLSFANQDGKHEIEDARAEHQRSETVERV
jgi:hypothetical protein